MIDVLMTIVVVIALAGVTAVLSTSYPSAMRRWVWFAFAEYLACAVAQLIYSRVINEGGDTLYYVQTGAQLSRFLDQSFAWSSRELLAMFLQQPSALDTLIFTPESNTGSMIAASAFLHFAFRGSGYAVHFFVAGLSLFGALSIYRAANDAYPEGSSTKLFVATVLFPSIAFWTSALHKEAFAIVGIGALLSAWRSIYKKQLRALVYAPIGIGLILLFRAPALPPLLLGIVIFVAWDRLKKSRSADVVLVGPLYLGVGIVVLVLGMTAVARVSPALGLDRVQETVATSQKAWTLVQGGSTFATNEDVQQHTLGAQALRMPLALVNALFRPQLFDVHNLAALISALEMTVIVYLLLRAIRHDGFGGVFMRIQRSPFLVMCAVVTVVGCAMVGLVTLNFGSLARYRVPFLPFYGALVVALNPARSRAATGAPLPVPLRAGGRLRGRPPRAIPRRSRPL